MFKHFIALLFLFSASSFAGPMKEVTNIDQLESYIEESEFSGVLAVSQGDKILFQKAYGFRDYETRNANKTSDRFQIGSVSKQFVAAALLKLEQENKLILENDVTQYLPNFTLAQGVKVVDLLNHSSGIPNYTDQNEFWQNVNYNKVLTLNEITDFIANYKLEFAPRTQFKYSNTNYIIAGHIVEILSGQTWDQYIKDNFLIPLNMKDTGYTPYFKEVSPVVGHVPNENGVLTPITDFNLSWALSAGALYSTVDDLLKWTDIYEKSNVLTESSKIKMQTPFMKNYALGVQIIQVDDKTVISHGGRTPGFVTNLSYTKPTQLKIVSLNNTDGGKGDVTSVVSSYFESGKALALKVTDYPIDPKILPEYVGTYSDGKLNFEVSIKDNKLYLQPNDGQPAYLLIANDKDSFRLMGVAGEEFIRDSNNQVIALKHYQSGKVSLFNKLPSN